MKKTHYNIFLNYRRNPGRDFARTLQQAFKARGYSVFFDYDSLQDGKFNEEIYDAIENCDVFIATYSLGSLDRCKNDGDWVRIEIEHALKHGKKVIPLAPTEVFYNWSFPRDLPPTLSVLRNIQTTEIHTGKYFDDSVDHCVNERFPKGIVHIQPEQPKADAQEAGRLFLEGRKHEYGAYERCDMNKALECYRAAAEMGHPDAQFEVGSAYSNGWGGRVRDMELAVEWWKKAADGGSPDALSALADLHVRGEMLERDKTRAKQLFQEAFSVWKRRADAGDARAQCCLANCYEEGKGTDVNPRLAATWYRKAAEHNDIWALLQLGEYGVSGYSLGGYSLDEDEQQKWHELAVSATRRLAEKGNPWFQEIYSGMVSGEDGESAEALKWLELAAQQGNGSALWQLGVRHLQGVEMPVDFEKGCKLLSQAVQNGFRDAYHYYGICLLLGFDPAMEYADIEDLLAKAADLFEQGAKEETWQKEDSRQLLETIRESGKRSGPRAAAALARAKCWIELSKEHADNGHSAVEEEDIRKAIHGVESLAKDQFHGEDAVFAAKLLRDYAERILASDASHAQDICKEALAIADGLEKGTNQTEELKGSILTVLAKSQMDMGKNAAAHSALQEALGHFDGLHAPGHGHDEKRGVCLLLLGKSHAEQKHWSEAVPLLQETRSIFSKLAEEEPSWGSHYNTFAAEAAFELARCFSRLNNRHPADMWVQNALKDLPDPEALQAYRDRHRTRYMGEAGWYICIPDIEKIRKIKSACEKLLPEVRLFNHDATDKVPRLIFAPYGSNHILAKTGWNISNTHCDMIVFDEVCTIPLLLLPEKQELHPIRSPTRDNVVSSTGECIHGNTVFPELLARLAGESLDAIYPNRKARKRHCRCLVVCGTSTVGNIRASWGKWLDHWERETGLKFCAYSELQTELGRCFNWEPQHAETEGEVRYEVWIEGLPFDSPQKNAIMVGSAMRAMAKGWSRFKSVLTMGHRIDFSNPYGTGVLVQKLTREEAFRIRADLANNGAIASARPMTKVVENTGKHVLEANRHAAPSPGHNWLMVGRNDSCPCGSGKKYKNCCAQRLDYAVRDGETVDALARLFGVDGDDLRRLNGFKDGEEVTPGQVIKIP